MSLIHLDPGCSQIKKKRERERDTSCALVYRSLLIGSSAWKLPRLSSADAEMEIDKGISFIQKCEKKCGHFLK